MSVINRLKCLLSKSVITTNSIYNSSFFFFIVQIALNQAIKAAEEGENAEGEISLDDVIKEPVLQRTRKRPKRDV